MVKISSEKVTNSRNVTFLGKMFGDVYDAENFRAFKNNKANNLDSSTIEINIENEKQTKEKNHKKVRCEALKKMKNMKPKLDSQKTRTIPKKSKIKWIKKYSKKQKKR